MGALALRRWMRKIEMDEKDRALLKELKANSRATVKELAKKTRIRPSTVHKRLQKLRNTGIIEKYTVKLNNKKVQEDFIVFMLVKTKPQTVLDERIFRDDHIKEVFGITGDYDLFIKLKFKGIEEFNRFIIKFRKENDIETTTTMISTVEIKEEL